MPRIIILSILATATSLLISIAIQQSGFSTQSVGPVDSEQEYNVSIHSREEALARSEVARLSVERQIQEFADQRRSELFDKTVGPHLFVSWIPWFVMGMVVSFKGTIEKLVVLLLPLLLTATKVFSVYEFLLFGFFLFVALAVKRFARVGVT